MKFVIFAMLFLIIATSSKADNVITIGTNSVPATFDDTGLSDSVKSLICKDLSNYFSYGKNIDTVFHIQGTADCRRLNSVINSKHAKGIMDSVYLTCTNGLQMIYIKSKLTNMYTDILRMTPDVLNIVSNATDFIHLFNSCQVTNYSPGAKCAMFRSIESPEIPTVTNEIVNGIDSNWIKEKYTLPAIIDYNPMIVWSQYPRISIFTIRSYTDGARNVPEAATQYIGCISNQWFFIAY